MPRRQLSGDRVVIADHNRVGIGCGDCCGGDDMDMLCPLFPQPPPFCLVTDFIHPFNTDPIEWSCYLLEGLGLFDFENNSDNLKVNLTLDVGSIDGDIGAFLSLFGASRNISQDGTGLRGQRAFLTPLNYMVDTEIAADPAANAYLLLQFGPGAVGAAPAQFLFDLINEQTIISLYDIILLTIDGISLAAQHEIQIHILDVDDDAEFGIRWDWLIDGGVVYSTQQGLNENNEIFCNIRTRIQFFVASFLPGQPPDFEAGTMTTVDDWGAAFF